MPTETERKYLVRSRAYREQAVGADRIAQGYLSTDHGRTVRVRLRAGRGYLTIKGPADATGVSRYEWEMEIPAADAHDLMRLCLPGVIDKTRYLVPMGQHTAEVDEFYGENAGLVVAEVELTDANEPVALPDFFGPEVTADARFCNSQLTLHPFRTWPDDEQRRIALPDDDCPATPSL